MACLITGTIYLMVFQESSISPPPTVLFPIHGFPFRNSVFRVADRSGALGIGTLHLLLDRLQAHGQNVDAVRTGDHVFNGDLPLRAVPERTGSGVDPLQRKKRVEARD